MPLKYLIAGIGRIARSQTERARIQAVPADEKIDELLVRSQRSSSGRTIRTRWLP